MGDTEVVRRSSSKISDKDKAPDTADNVPAQTAEDANGGADEKADDETVLWEPYGRFTKQEFKKKAWKNILVLATANMLVYISFLGLIDLQSSLHVQEGMGVINLSIRYATLFVSCLTAPDLLIRALSHKWLIVISFFSFFVWDLANGYAVWATMIPASILNGFFVGPLYVARNSYITGLARMLADVFEDSKASTVTFVYGIVVTFHILAGAIGATISFFILDIDPGEVEYKPSEQEVADNCGLNDCPWNVNNGTFFTEVPRDTVWTLVFIYLVCCIAAVFLVIISLDHFPRNLLKLDKTLKEEFCHLLLASFRQMKNPKQLMIIPYTIFLGIGSSFYVASFTKSWITCGIGIQYNGLISLPIGFWAALLFALTGRLVKLTGRVPLLVVGNVFDFISTCIMFFWRVNPNQIYVFFIFPMIGTVAGATWECCVGAMNGYLFPDSTEAAFANYLLWDSLAFSIGLAYDPYFCTDVKLYIMLVAQVIGCLFIYALEFCICVENRKQKTEETTKEVD